MDKVIPGLYIGDIAGANDKKLIKTKKITHIVSCHPAYVHDGIIYHNIHVDDDETVNLYSHFYNAVEFIDDALSQGNNVFVHCYAGISRSASIVLAYLMAIKKYKLTDAIELLVSKRKICDPNRGFLLQLQCFEWALSLMPKTYTVCTGLQAQCNATGVTQNSRSRHSSSGAMGLESSVSGTICTGIESPALNVNSTATGAMGLEFSVSGITPTEICKGPVFKGIQFDFAKHEVLFCEDLETIYDGCIFIDRSIMPGFRPVITDSVIANHSENTYQIDILQYIIPKLKDPKRILIVSTDNRTLVVVYWNLLYRSGMSYDDSFKYFKNHVSPELNNTFDSVSRTILYPFITPCETIIATQLARLDILDKRCDTYYLSGNLKRNVKSLHAFIDNVPHYFISEIQERAKAISEKLDRQNSMCV